MAAFEAAIAVVPREDAERIRATFVEKRLDQQYAEQAAEALRLHQFSDGLAYTGYLWDFLVDKHVVTEEEVWDGVGPAPEIYAMWDLHSAERIRTPDYFRFPKGTVLRTDPATLRGGIDYLPEDLYIFDATCSWAAALTHECVDERRFCIWSGERVGATMAGGAQNQSP
jgi:hypothetical protein